jgi:hypothetical protein
MYTSVHHIQINLPVQSFTFAEVRHASTRHTAVICKADYRSAAKEESTENSFDAKQY